MRIAFVGQGRYFLAASFEGKKRNSIGVFIDLDHPSLTTEVIISEIIRFKPDLIVVFRPDFFQDLTNIIYKLQAAPVAGYFSEPIGHRFSFFVDNLRSRRNALRQSLKSLHLDYTICFTDELAVFVSRFRTVHAVFPLPVNDDLFVNQEITLESARILFVGRLNDYRIGILDFVKHRFNPIIVDNGFDYRDLSLLLNGKSAIALNIHVGKMKTFEHRALVHMAAGHLMLSQTLAPDFGFLPDCEYINFNSGSELVSKLNEIYSNPELALWIARRGNQMARRHAASNIWTDFGKNLNHWGQTN